MPRAGHSAVLNSGHGIGQGHAQVRHLGSAGWAGVTAMPINGGY
jgi:hypothetical protein